MKRFLRWFALCLALGATVFWLGAGAHRGWTKNSVAKKALDEVTGIEGISYEQRFVPGVDFLAVAWALAGGLGAVSLVRRPNSARNPRNNNGIL